MAALIQKQGVQEIFKVCDTLMSVLEERKDYKTAVNLTKDLVSNVKNGDINLSSELLGDKSEKVMADIDKIDIVLGNNHTLTGADIKAIYSSIIEMTKSVAIIIVDIYKGNYGNLIDDVYDLAQDFMAVVGALAIGVEKMAALIKHTLEPLIDKVLVKLDHLIEKVSDKFDNMQGKLDKFTDKVILESKELQVDANNLLKEIKDDIKEDIKRLSEKAQSKFEEISQDTQESLDKIETFFDKVGDDIRAGFENFSEDSKQALNKVESFFDKVFHKEEKTVTLKTNNTASIEEGLDLYLTPVLVGYNNVDTGHQE